MEIRFASRVDRVAFGCSLMTKLMEIVVVRRPAESERIACLVVSYGRHNRYLTQEFLTRGEVVLVPSAVIAFAAHEIAVHEGHIAVEIADEILHVRPVLARIAVDIADGEDPVRRSLFGCGLGPTDLRTTPVLIRADGEVITRVGL